MHQRQILLEKGQQKIAEGDRLLEAKSYNAAWDAYTDAEVSFNIIGDRENEALARRRLDKTECLGAVQDGYDYLNSNLENPDYWGAIKDIESKSGACKRYNEGWYKKVIIELQELDFKKTAPFYKQDRERERERAASASQADSSSISDQGNNQGTCSSEPITYLSVEAAGASEPVGGGAYEIENSCSARIVLAVVKTHDARDIEGLEIVTIARNDTTEIYSYFGHAPNPLYACFADENGCNYATLKRFIP
ncbi:MAG: hypothetical protein GC182_21225 [Rhodopseudomonas sp.]|nr:hypothetical protein [Rhodopseudomonas sp.]